MADYDVQALGLASPPASAPATTYYPGVSVRNNGKYPADVTGYVRQYDRDTGLLVATYQVSRNNVQPDTTENVATASPLVWTLADVGKKFLFQGWITAAKDTVPGNNYFGPVEVEVTGETPPPPPIETHHHQHENGGADELNLDGLAGLLAEKQTPTEHAAHHEVEGEDELNVEDLSGELADPQTPKAHAGTHGVGGSDPVSGVTPAAHRTSHETGGADALVGFEKTANKGEASGYAPLDEAAKVPTLNLGGEFTSTGQFLRADQTWAFAAPEFAEPESLDPSQPNDEGEAEEAARADHKHRTSGGIATNWEQLATGSSAVKILEKDLAEEIAADDFALRFNVAGAHYQDNGLAPEIYLTWQPDGGSEVTIATVTLDATPDSYVATFVLQFYIVMHRSGSNLQPNYSVLGTFDTFPTYTKQVICKAAAGSSNAADAGTLKAYIKCTDSAQYTISCVGLHIDAFDD